MKLHRIVISGRQPGPRLLILGGVHGDEYEPIAAVRRLIDWVDRDQLQGELTLVPVVNKPAFAHRGRTGPDGLDLARTFPGNSKGNTTEQIAFAAAEWIRQADFLIDLHTGGLAMRIDPLVGYMLVPDEATLAQQRAMARAFGLPVVWGSSPSLEGRTLSVARDAKIPAIYAEYGGGGGCDPKGVAAYVQGCLNVMARLQMMPPTSHQAIDPLVVEDRRDQSGLLQQNYLAPHDGYYEPSLLPGAAVAPGDELGRLDKLDGSPPTTIVALQQGRLLLTRALPVVAAGDCLAFVLEIDQPEGSLI